MDPVSVYYCGICGQVVPPDANPEADLSAAEVVDDAWCPVICLPCMRQLDAERP